MKHITQYLTIMLFFVTVQSVARVTGKCGNNVTWELKETTGELKISGSGEMYCTDGSYSFFSGYWDIIKTVVIDKGITSIGEYSFKDLEIYSVTIPNTVKSIGDYAFANCWELTSVTIPNSVTSIGNGAFGGCHSLTSVTIPNSVKSIGSEAFSYCSELVDVYNAANTPQSSNGDIPSSCKIHVRAGLKDKYKSSTSWGKYTIIDDIIPLINISASGNGSVASDGIVIREGEKTLEKIATSSCLLTFTPDEGYKVSLVTVDDKDVTADVKNNTYTLNVDKEKTNVSVTFSKIPEQLYEVNITSSANGSVKYKIMSVSNGSHTFKIKGGSEVVLTVKPKEGCVLKSFVVNGKDETAKVKDDTYTIAFLSGVMNISATFEEISYEVYDVNHDFQVNSADVVTVYNYIINGK